LVCLGLWGFRAILGFELRTLCFLGGVVLLEQCSLLFFCFSYFEDRVLLFCPGWTGIMILPISVSQVVRITGVSLQYQALIVFLKGKRFNLDEVSVY
jgi:hypothetical protein